MLRDRILKFSNILIAATFFSVASSFMMQYLFDLIPCRLCLYQRYVWMLLLAICFFLITVSKRYYLGLLFLTLTCLVFILFLGLYHSLIELNIINNILTCSEKNQNLSLTLEELDKNIRSTNNNDCSFIKFSFLGLTLSNYSVLLSIFLIFLNLKNLKKELF